MKIVLDTNCFISCIGKKSAYRSVFDGFLNSRYSLCVSTEILLEYEEKFAEFWGESIAHNLLGTLLTSENISFHSVFYNFLLVAGDEDDNKFTDVYIAAAADILVTNDSSIIAVAKSDFPKITVMTLKDFMNLLAPQ